MAFVLAIDQGTTSSRAIVFDGDGRALASSQRELPQHFPAPGWVEHDAEDIWSDTRETARAALARAGVAASELDAIGVSNQRETAVIWSRETGEPIHRAIVWQDRRTAPLCRELIADGLESHVHAKTGLVIDAYFSATKIAWLLDTAPGARAAAERGELAFGTIDCFLLWRMTNGAVHATDASNAARTMLFDITAHDWDETLLARLRIPRSLLPEVRDNACEFGVAHEDFLGAAVPVRGMAGDQQAATIGQACFQTGMLKSTYGTGCFALLNTGADPHASEHKLLTTIGYRLGGRTTYALEGSIFVAGAAVQWVRDGLGAIDAAEESEALARSIEDTGGVYLVPAFTGLGAPWWDPGARGALLGLTRDSGRPEIVRAALESVAYQTLDLMRAMQADATAVEVGELRVDGGMVANDWVCQFLADILARPVVRPQVIETTALGAAYLAGLQSGLWSSTEDIARNWRLDRRFEPRMSADRRDALLAGWRDAVSRVRSSA